MRRVVWLSVLVLVALLPGPAGARNDGVSSLPEYVGPFPDTENMVFHGQVTPTEMGALPIGLFGIAKGFVSDIEGWTSSIGTKYALVTHTNGIGFVRVADTVEFVGTIPAFIDEPRTIFNVSHLWGDPDSWTDPETGVSYGYFTREGFGELLGDPRFDTDLIIVEDLDVLDSLPAAAPGTDISGEFEIHLRRPGGYEGAHNIEIDEEGFAYLPGVHLESGAANNACGLEQPPDFNTLILDVGANPTDPPVVACVPEGEHDVFVVNDYDGPDADYLGEDIAFIFDGITAETFIWNVTDRANPAEITRYSLAAEGMAFSHNGVPTEDLRHLFIGDELDEFFDALFNRNRKPQIGTYIVDISDLDEPTLDERFTYGQVGIDHNSVVHDGKLYTASYNSGTRVFDIVDEPDDSITLSPIAHMDTEPRLPNNIFNVNQELRFTSNFLGQWGIDVFADGTIIASDLNNGVVVSSVSATPCRFKKCQP